MEPKYTILTKLKKSKIDPGDTLETEIYLSGYGDVEKNKLFFLQPSPVSEENPGQVKTCIQSERDPHTWEFIKPVTGEEYIQRSELDETGTIIILEKGNFSKVPSFSAPDLGYPQFTGEGTWDEHPPILLKSNISEDASPGDYQIQIVLTYGGEGEEVFQSRKDVEFHINTFRERNEKALAILGTGIIGTIIAFLTLIF